LRAARRRGLRLPRDLSVVGSDDIPIAEFIEPPLTTVHQPVAEIADAATRALLGEISGDHPPRAEYLFHPRLIVRESTTGPRHGARRRVVSLGEPGDGEVALSKGSAEARGDGRKEPGRPAPDG
jgi:substrate-binding family protein